jgi:phosphonate transport system substrate-binding protein
MTRGTNDPNSTSGYLVPSAFFLMEMGVDPKKHFSKLTFSGSHEASILAVANKKGRGGVDESGRSSAAHARGQGPARRPPGRLGLEADPQ